VRLDAGPGAWHDREEAERGGGRLRGRAEQRARQRRRRARGRSRPGARPRACSAGCSVAARRLRAVWRVSLSAVLHGACCVMRHRGRPLLERSLAIPVLSWTASDACSGDAHLNTSAFAHTQGRAGPVCVGTPFVPADTRSLWPLAAAGVRNAPRFTSCPRCRAHAAASPGVSARRARRRLPDSAGGARARRQAHAQAEAQASRLDLEQRLDAAGRELRAAREEGAALRDQLGKLLEEAAAGRAATDGARPGRRAAPGAWCAGAARQTRGPINPAPGAEAAGVGLRASARARGQTSLAHQSRRCRSLGTSSGRLQACCLSGAHAAGWRRRRTACAKSGVGSRAHACAGCARRRRRAAAGGALPAPGEGGGDRGAAPGAARADAPALRPGRRAARRAGGQRAGAARRPARPLRLRARLHARLHACRK